MKLVNDRLAVKAKMLTPNNSGYILLAAELDRIKPFGPPSPAQRPDILEATLFRAVLIAPGEGTPRPL
jgi:hypothetical protein